MTPETASVDESIRDDGPSARLLEELLARADIRLDGGRPWDMRLLAPGVAERILARGSLGLGESYMDGAWEADALDEFFARLLRAGLDWEVRPWRLLGHALRARLFNLQTPRRARRVGEVHYDLGNDFYQAMLDARMTYSCGYWRQARTLDEAQEAKLDLVCRKLDLRPGQRVLDIGCGWGSFARFAAERYGVEVVGVTISREQLKLGRELCRGLPVELRLQDYRALDEPFDHIASLGMFEHVGHKNYRTYLEIAHRCLREDGLFLLHTIGKPRSGTPTDPWVERYVFPNGELPALVQVVGAAEGLFIIEDLHNFGADYDRTLMAWHRNFEVAWPRFAERYGERFRRMWRYYLLACAGAFRARNTQLWQIVFAKEGHAPLGGYRRPE